jgi:hypothetical protein
MPTAQQRIIERHERRVMEFLDRIRFEHLDRFLSEFRSAHPDAHARYVLAKETYQNASDGRRVTEDDDALHALFWESDGLNGHLLQSVNEADR